MAFFIDTFLERQRKQWLRSLNAVEVQVGTTWYRGELNQKEIVGDTLMIKATFPTMDPMACTITASRILDVHGEVAAYQQRSIKKAAGQGTMIKITIPLYEVKV